MTSAYEGGDFMFPPSFYIWDWGRFILKSTIWEAYSYVLEAYPSTGWARKISTMSTQQVYAIYRSIKLRKAIEFTIEEGLVYGNRPSTCTSTPLRSPTDL